MGLCCKPPAGALVFIVSHLQVVLLITATLLLLQWLCFLLLASPRGSGGPVVCCQPPQPASGQVFCCQPPTGCSFCLLSPHTGGPVVCCLPPAGVLPSVASHMQVVPAFSVKIYVPYYADDLSEVFRGESFLFHVGQDCQSL